MCIMSPWLFNVYMDTVLLGIRRMDKVPNARISQLCGVTKDADEKIDKGVVRWFDHGERIENDRIA